MRVKPNKMITKNTKLPQINFLKKKQTNKLKTKKNMKVKILTEKH